MLLICRGFLHRNTLHVCEAHFRATYSGKILFLLFLYVLIELCTAVIDYKCDTVEWLDG